MGELDRELTTRVFAAALASSTKGSLFGEFPEVGDYRTYWGRVYHEAVTRAARTDRESPPQSDATPDAVDTELTVQSSSSGWSAARILGRTVSRPLLRTVWTPLLPSPSVPVRGFRALRPRCPRTHSGRRRPEIAPRESASVLVSGSPPRALGGACCKTVGSAYVGSGTQHLPLPAKTPRWLRYLVPAGRFFSVPACITLSFAVDRCVAGSTDGIADGRQCP